MFDVLVTGAETRQGVVVIRSLAKKGIRMLAIGEHPNAIGFYSKHISGRALLPSSLGWWFIVPSSSGDHRRRDPPYVRLR